MKTRDRGDGYVYQRGRRWWVKYSVRGRVYRESSHSTDRREAVRLLRRRLSEIAAGRHAPDAEKVRLEDLIGMVEDDYRLNGRRSLDRVQRAFGHVHDYFGPEARAVEISTDRITAYARARTEEGAAPATVMNELAALKRGFSLAVRAGRIQNKPAFPTLRVDNARKGFIQEADFRALLAEMPEYLRPPLTFAYLTGWRLASEVLSLRWTQVDAEAVRLEPGSTKNREGREWPLKALPELEDLIKKQRAYTDAVERKTGQIVPWVWHRPDGRPIRSLRKAWDRACRRAGLVGLIPHDLRRSAVRALERASVPRSVAMKLVGHKTEAIYRRYAIVSSKDLAEGVAKLAALREATPADSKGIIPFGHSSGTIRRSDEYSADIGLAS